MAGIAPVPGRERRRPTGARRRCAALRRTGCRLAGGFEGLSRTAAALDGQRAGQFDQPVADFRIADTDEGAVEAKALR